MMESLFGHVFARLIGRVGLLLYYRNMKKVRLVLAEKYNNSYAEAGSDVIFRLVGITGILLMVALIIATIYGTIFR